jgi:hypothetical protein
VVRKPSVTHQIGTCLFIRWSLSILVFFLYYKIILQGRGGRRGVGVVSGLARSPRVNRINQMVVARSSGVTDVHARLGWTGQQQKRSNIINQRRNLTVSKNTYMIR